VSTDTLTRPDVSVEGSRAELDRIARELDDRSKSLWNTEIELSRIREVYDEEFAEYEAEWYRAVGADAERGLPAPWLVLLEGQPSVSRPRHGTTAAGARHAAPRPRLREPAHRLRPRRADR
jgi:hypothetical protein